jgi:DNA-binding response OmpR family regulator
MDNALPLLLVVEDDSSTRYILTRILGQSGWRVVAVPTIAEGVQLLEARPACVLVDLQLSDGRGEVLLGQIREQGQSGRVVICTAIRDKDRIDELSTLRPDAIIYKPIEMHELIAACSVA